MTGSVSGSCPRRVHSRRKIDTTSMMKSRHPVVWTVMIPTWTREDSQGSSDRNVLANWGIHPGNSGGFCQGILRLLWGIRSRILLCRIAVIIHFGVSITHVRAASLVSGHDRDNFHDDGRDLTLCDRWRLYVHRDNRAGSQNVHR